MHSPQVMHTLDIVAYTAFVAGLVTLPVLLVNWFRYMKKINADRSMRPPCLKAPFPVKTVLAFIVPLLVCGSAAQVSKSFAHDDVLNELRALPRDSRVLIGERPVDDPQRILTVLENLEWASAHHSSPTHTIAVRAFSGSQELHLALSRDSSNPREYWVFFPKYAITMRNEIGRIFTDAFDAY